MTFSKRQLKKAATYSVIVALFIPGISGLLFLASLAPAPVRLKPDAKMTPNHYGHRYFHSKAELKVWMKENESKVHDISLANWEEIVLE